jgi:phenylalanyl-tRNA synthetase alpha chain
MQIRYMQSHTPPIRIVVPSRVFGDGLDLTHSLTFGQIEALAVAKAFSWPISRASCSRSRSDVFADDARAASSSFFP